MTTDHIAAAQVHAGDELIFTVRARCSGTTACSALDALSGASNFIIFTLAPDDPDGAAVIVVERSESVVTRAVANTAIGRAA